MKIDALKIEVYNENKFRDNSILCHNYTFSNGNSVRVDIYGGKRRLPSILSLYEMTLTEDILNYKVKTISVSGDYISVNLEEIDYDEVYTEICINFNLEELKGHVDELLTYWERIYQRGKVGVKLDLKVED